MIVWLKELLAGVTRQEFSRCLRGDKMSEFLVSILQTYPRLCGVFLLVVAVLAFVAVFVFMVENKNFLFTVSFVVLVISMLGSMERFGYAGEKDRLEGLASAEFVCSNIWGEDGVQWSRGSCAPVQKEPFLVRAVMMDDVIFHTTTTTEGEYSSWLLESSGTYRQWEDGEGILPVKVLGIEPSFPGIGDGSLILLKTIDLKAMGLEVGAVMEFLCRQDAEVLPPVYSGQKLTPEYIIYELDSCRMVAPGFSNGE